MNRDKLSVRLFHGRKHPDERLDDWGFDGPVLGPLNGVHLTYGNVALFGEEHERVELPSVEDLLFYAGGYFGDVSISSATLQPPNAQYDERLTVVPKSEQKRERLPIVVPKGHRREYLRRVEVFIDSIRELVGDGGAAAVSKALTQVVKS